MIQGLLGRDPIDHPLPVELEPTLDPLDMRLRLAQLAALKDGWLDGKGLVPAEFELEWFATTFEMYFDPTLPLPYLYPTPEGGLQAEWSLTTWEISLEIDLATRQADYQALNLIDHSCSDVAINLSSPEGWHSLNNALKNLLKQDHGVGN